MQVSWSEETELTETQMRELDDWFVVEAECAAVAGDLAACGLMPDAGDLPTDALPWEEWADNLAA